MSDQFDDDKIFLDSDFFRDDCYRLGAKVIESGYRPTVVAVILWGASLTGLYVKKFFETVGLDTKFMPVVTKVDYDSQEELEATEGLRPIEVGSGYGSLVAHFHEAKNPQRLLALDEVSHTLSTLIGLRSKLRQDLGDEMPEFRSGVNYWKPGQRRADETPDYWNNQAEGWIVFPGSLDPKNMTQEEMWRYRGKTVVDLVKRCREIMGQA